MPNEIDTTSPIRRFSDASIQASVDKALSTLSPNEHGAVVAYANGDKVQLAALARLGSNWSVVGVLEKLHGGKLSGEAQVRFSW